MWREKKWLTVDVDEASASRLAEAVGISKIIAQILVSRKVTEAAAAREFLYGKERPFYSPYLLKGMDTAVKRICQAIENKEKIVVFGDYDVDGITACSLLYLFFRELGQEVSFYIPERQAEGYGLNGAALQQLADDGFSLVITVDCGISACTEVQNAPAGLDIIITDHHSPPEVLPAALAIINPRQDGCAYPYKELAGVGVAFKLCQGLWQALVARDEFWSGHLEIVALGTIADIVPLTGENRELVRRGLAAMRATTNIGLKSLLEVSRTPCAKVNTGVVGFGLAPRLNAAGRMANARSGVQLLISGDEGEAQGLAMQLEEENSQRQSIEKLILQQAESQVLAQGEVGPALVLAGENWHPGVIGIVASRLVDKYHVPVVMISIGEDKCKGSCRSIEAFDLYKGLSALAEWLIQYGGHHQAAGLTIEREKIAGFRKALCAYAKMSLSADDYLPVQKIAAQVEALSDIDSKLIDELEKMEPYGMGNPTPVLSLNDVSLYGAAAMGMDSQHLKLVVRQEKAQLPAVMWRNGSYSNALYDGAKAALAFVPEINDWRNEKELRLRLLDIKKSGLLVDLREFCSRQKAELLKGILQTGKKTVVYCNDDVLCEADGGSLFRLGFEEYCKQGVEQVVFWQPPYKVLEDDLWWKSLQAAGVKSLYLLYNKEDVNVQLSRIGECYPDYESLKAVYRLVRAGGGGAKEMLVQEYGLPDGLLCLEILLEIGALVDSEGKLSVAMLKDNARLNLAASRVYGDLQEEQQRMGIMLRRCLEMERREFARLLFA